MMKKYILLLLLQSQSIFAQIQYSPNAIVIGNTTNQSIPLLIQQEGFRGGIVQRHNIPRIELINANDNSTQSISCEDGVFGFNFYKTNGATTFFTNNTLRVSISNSLAIFKNKLIADAGITLLDSSKPLNFNDLPGSNGAILVSSGTSANWATPPASHPINGFSAYNSTNLIIPSSTSPVALSNFTLEFNDQGSLDFFPNTGVYIAPTNGVYHFDLNIPEITTSPITPYTGRFVLTMLVNNVEHESTRKSIIDHGLYTINMVTTVKLQAGDSVKFQFISVNTNNSDVQINNLIGLKIKLSGYKIY